MKVDTERFGSIEIDPETVIQMIQGPYGFEGLCDFCLLEHAPGCDFRWLQSLTAPELAFVVVDPMQFFPDYEVELEDEDARELDLESPADALVLAIATIPGDVKQTSINLLGPIIINAANRKAKQVVLQNDLYTTKHHLLESPALGQAAMAEAGSG